jgi:hypothetical protein
MRLVVPAAATAALVALAGCGSSGGGSPSSVLGSAASTAPSGVSTTGGAVGQPSSGPQSPTAAGSPSGVGSPTDARASSAGALAEQMVSAMKSATSFHVRAAGTTSGKSLKINMHYGKNSSKGSLTLGGTTIDLLSAGGDTYFKAPDSFWKQQVPKQGRSDVLRMVSGKWLKVPASNSHYGDFVKFTFRKTFVSQLTSGLNPSKITKGGEKAINGTDAVGLVDTAKNSTIYVPVDGTPYPIK